MNPTLFFPSIPQLERTHSLQQTSDFSYPELGHTKLSSTPGYDNDYNFRHIGSGEESWQRAKTALQNWQQFPTSWTRIFPAHVPPQEGQNVLVVFRLFGLWWINAARILYTFDEPHRFGFAYGTLKQHVERGEECFWLERDAAGEISYHIKAFSSPQFWGAKLAYPLARRYQRRFVRQSMEQMANLAMKPF